MSIALKDSDEEQVEDDEHDGDQGRGQLWFGGLGNASRSGHQPFSLVRSSRLRRNAFKRLALGIGREEALGAVRLSIGRTTTREEVEAAAAYLGAAWRSLRVDEKALG
jgi:hypothetical protein